MFILHGAAGDWDEVIAIVIAAAMAFLILRLLSRGPGHEEQREESEPGEDVLPPEVPQRVQLWFNEPLPLRR